MRHLGQIGNDGIPGNILAQAYRHAAGSIFKFICIEDIAQIDPRTGLIRHFNAHGSLPGNRRFDKNLCRRQIQGNVIGQTDNPAHAHPSCRFQFITGDRRALTGIRHFGFNVETFQCFLQNDGILTGFFTQSFCQGFSRFEQAHRRQAVCIFSFGHRYGRMPLGRHIDGRRLGIDFDWLQVGQFFLQYIPDRLFHRLSFFLLFLRIWQSVIIVVILSSFRRQHGRSRRNR